MRRAGYHNAPLVHVHYPESRFGGFTDVDGTITFFARVNALLEPEILALDVGCGRGAGALDPIPFRLALRTLRGKCRRVIGIDIDDSARANPLVDEFRLIVDVRWPVEDASVGLCVADWVLEHVEDPDAFLAEARRVLEPGGHLCLRTSNLLGYIGLFSRFLPGCLHTHALARIQPERMAEDIFPTRYRCNTIWSLRRALAKHGFVHTVYGYEAEPSYFTSSPLLYRLAKWHQRLAPQFMRLALFAFARRL